VGIPCFPPFSGILPHEQVAFARFAAVRALKLALIPGSYTMNTSHLPSDLARSIAKVDEWTAWLASLDATKLKTSKLFRTYALLTASDPSPHTADLLAAWRAKAQECEAEIDRRFPIPPEADGRSEK